MPEALPVRTRVLDFLREHHVMTLATHDAEGPWGAAVFYANHSLGDDDFRFVFLSSPATRHAQAIAMHPRVGATIQRDYEEWPEIRGMQIEGDVRVLAGDEETRARAIYAARFPAVGNLARAPAVIVRALAKVRWYELVARRLRLIDNTLGFGHSDEIVTG